MKLSLEQAFYAIAGIMIILSAALTHFVSPYWGWFTVFIGANMFQFAFTGFCPMIVILKAAGLKSATCPISSCNCGDGCKCEPGCCGSPEDSQK